MPLFDFHCTACRNTFELLVRASDTPVCPGCGSPGLEKLLSRPAAPGTSAELIHRARSQAAREGHFSHYKRSGKP